MVAQDFMSFKLDSSALERESMPTWNSEAILRNYFDGEEIEKEKVEKAIETFRNLIYRNYQDAIYGEEFAKIIRTYLKNRKTLEK